MPEGDGPETWLLLDAAGPTILAGIWQGSRFLAAEETSGDVLEWLPGAVEAILCRSGASLGSLQGAVYGRGPGSTLGLRVAALFLRALMSIPAHRHWLCLGYLHLEVALAAGLDKGPEAPEAAVAPWRRDRLHRAELAGTERPLRFRHGPCSPEETHGAAAWLLGRRPLTSPEGSPDWQPFPLQALPRVLDAYPELLHPLADPEPFMAETPEFAIWNATRHTAT